jgi:hypothetical protein
MGVEKPLAVKTLKMAAFRVPFHSGSPKLAFLSQIAGGQVAILDFWVGRDVISLIPTNFNVLRLEVSENG